MADKKTDKEPEKEKDKKEKPQVVAAAAAPVQKAPPKPPGMIKLFLFVAMPLMVFQAGIAYFLISRYMTPLSAPTKSGEHPSPESDTHEQTSDSTSTDSESHEGKASDAKQGQTAHSKLLDDTEEEKNHSFTHYLKDIIVNPAATAGTRFLNVSFAFDYGREKLKDELEGEDFRIRDAIINLLVTKRIDEIDGADDKELLRQQTLTVVNDMLKIGRIRKVYFTNFVIQ